MRHWSQLSTRNLQAKPGRTLLAIIAIALGVGVVVWVTGCYESVRRSINDLVHDWIGRSHVTVEAVTGRWGLVHEDLLAPVRALPNVDRITTRTMEWAVALRPDNPNANPLRIEVSGVEPDNERFFRTYELAAGRWLKSGESHAVLAEEQLARDLALKVGDELLIQHVNFPDQIPMSVKLVGLLQRRRATARQLPMLWAPIGDVQTLAKTPQQFKGADIILKDASAVAVRQAEADVNRIADEYRNRHGTQLKVATTEAQLNKLRSAQALLQFILLLSGCVLLLTAFFIITSTISMGIVERVRQIGLLRCVGMTRRQTAASVLFEAVPIGVAGIAAGIPLGLALQWQTIQLAPEYVGTTVLNAWGVILGVCGGLGAALFGAALPALHALRVSPVEATRPLAQARRTWTVFPVALLGLAILAGHQWVMGGLDAGDESLGSKAVIGVVLLYAGYALATPAFVVMIGSAAVVVTATLLRLPRQMLGEEVHGAPWRSAAVSSSIMVGLSMIMGLVVWAASIKSGWNFPREFPEALLYSWKDVPLADAQSLAEIPGVKDLVLADEFPYTSTPPREESGSVFSQITGALRGDPDKFSRIVSVSPDDFTRALSLTFLEGDEATAIDAMKRGDGCIVTRELAQARGYKVGDTITTYVQAERADWQVGGIVAAPAVDIAINFFNATEYFQIYSVGTIFISQQMAQQRFGRSYVRLIVFNFDNAALEAMKPETNSGRDRPESEYEAASGGGENRDHEWFELDSNALVGTRAQEAVVQSIRERLHLTPRDTAFATAAALKRQIDQNLDRVTVLLSAIPLIGLFVAALGVGNLMMASIASRRREIAVLRAVGLTRGQVLRMVLGEAAILGLIGSALGTLLGIHLAHSSQAFTRLLIGESPPIDLPWQLMTIAASTAILLCIVSGTFAAVRAARRNIAGSLHGA